MLRPPEGIRFPPEGIRFLAEGMLCPLEGIQFLAEGMLCPLEGIRFPLEGAAFLARGEAFPVEGLRFPAMDDFPSVARSRGANWIGLAGKNFDSMHHEMFYIGSLVPCRQIRSVVGKLKLVLSAGGMSRPFLTSFRSFSFRARSAPEWEPAHASMMESGFREFKEKGLGYEKSVGATGGTSGRRLGSTKR